MVSLGSCPKEYKGLSKIQISSELGKAAAMKAVSCLSEDSEIMVLGGFVGLLETIPLASLGVRSDLTEVGFGDTAGLSLMRGDMKKLDPLLLPPSESDHKKIQSHGYGTNNGQVLESQLPTHTEADLAHDIFGSIIGPILGDLVVGPLVEAKKLLTTGHTDFQFMRQFFRTYLSTKRVMAKARSNHRMNKESLCSRAITRLACLNEELTSEEQSSEALSQKTAIHNSSGREIKMMREVAPRQSVLPSGRKI
jgi:hypothetical protein